MGSAPGRSVRSRGREVGPGAGRRSSRSSMSAPRRGRGHGRPRGDRRVGTGPGQLHGPPRRPRDGQDARLVAGHAARGAADRRTPCGTPPRPACASTPRPVAVVHAGRVHATTTWRCPGEDPVLVPPRRTWRRSSAATRSRPGHGPAARPCRAVADRPARGHPGPRGSVPTRSSACRRPCSRSLGERLARRRSLDDPATLVPGLRRAAARHREHPGRGGIDGHGRDPAGTGMVAKPPLSLRVEPMTARRHPRRPRHRAGQLPGALADLRVPPGARDEPAGALPRRARRATWTVAYGGIWLMVDEAHVTTFAVLPELAPPGRRRRLMLALMELVGELGRPRR